MWATRSNGTLPTWKGRSPRATSAFPFDAATACLRSRQWRVTNAASRLNWPWNSQVKSASGASPTVDCAPHISSIGRYQTYCGHSTYARSNYVQFPGICHPHLGCGLTDDVARTNSRVVHAKIGMAGSLHRSGAAVAAAGGVEPTALATSCRRARARESEPPAAAAERANHGAIVAAGGSRRRSCAIRFASQSFCPTTHRCRRIARHSRL